MHTEITVHLEGVTPEVDHPKYGTVREPILRLGDADLVFPPDPEEAAGLALDMIDCLNEIRTDALWRVCTRQADWDASRRTPLNAPDPIVLATGASPAEVRHERLTEGVAS